MATKVYVCTFWKCIFPRCISLTHFFQRRIFQTCIFHQQNYSVFLKVDFSHLKRSWLAQIHLPQNLPEYHINISFAKTFVTHLVLFVDSLKEKTNTRGIGVQFAYAIGGRLRSPIYVQHWEWWKRYLFFNCCYKSI